MSPRSLCVLVVEDEPLNALLVQEQLRLAGFSMLGPVGSCQEALLLLERQRPDAALLDYMLGNQTCELLADELDQRGIPYVLLTACHPDLLPARFEEVATLLKPFYLTDLMDRLHAVIGSARPIE